jgi:hypothetical protein
VRGKWKFIPATVVAVLVLASLIAQVSGIERRILDLVFKPPRASLSNVRELALDTDLDGQPDLLEVMVRDSESYRCTYLLADADHDGTPEKFSSLMASRVACALFDDDKNGEFDRQVVGMHDLTDKNSRHQYQDLDLDGRFDIMVERYHGKTVAVHLLMKQKLIRALPGRTHDWREAWIEEADGTEVKVVFEDGEWRVVS